MSRLYRQPVDTRVTSGGLPAAFCWRGQWYQITSCSKWEDKLPWWEQFRYSSLPLRYRCETKQGVVCDLVKEGTKWLLERVWD